MARPQSPDYDKRRDAILAAAARLYARRGFQGASVADLAKACRTSKSLIYHYFPSKDDILYAAMATHLDALVAAAEEATRAGSAEQQLRALVHAFMRLYVGAEDSHKVLLNELDNLPPERRAEVVGKQRRIIGAVAAAHHAALRHDQLDAYLVQVGRAGSARDAGGCGRGADAGRTLLALIPF